MMQARIAAALGLLAVLLGAFGAHGLKDLLGHNGTGAIWEKAVFYHFIHAVMLFVLAQMKKCPPLPGGVFSPASSSSRAHFTCSR